jgi:predicted double-glycine peptidase
VLTPDTAGRCATRGPMPRRCLAAALIVLAATIAVPSSAAEQPRPVQSLLEQRRDGVVIQRWDLSCGAAALATILNFEHGDSVTEKEVAVGMMSREEYLANPDLVTLRQGFSLLDMKRFVDARGYRGVGLGRLTVDDLLEHAPIIVPISAKGYQHFVVFRGVRDGRALLADPAFGNRTVPLARFEAQWLAVPDVGRVGFYVERAEGRAPYDPSMRVPTQSAPPR